VRETVDPAGLKQTTRYGYDDNGNVTAKTDAAGQVTRYVYDGNDRLRYSIDPLGQVTEQRYDAAGHVIDTIRYAKTLAEMGASGGPVPQGIGLNGLSNGLFAPVTANQMAGWSYGAWRAGAVVGVNLSAERRVMEGLPGENTVYLHQTGRDPQDTYQELSQNMAVQAGHRYAFSAYTGADRATVTLHIVWYDANGECLGWTSEGTAEFCNAGEGLGGSQLSGYKRCVADGVAPPGAVRGMVSLRKRNTNVGETDSWLFATRAQFEELSLDAKGPSEWRPALVADPADQHSRTVYDAAGRQSYVMNAAGALTQYEYDAAGNVTVRRELANRVPTRGVKIKNADGRIHDIVKYMGSFSAGDVVTATVRCKAPAGLKNDVFLGNAAGPNPYDNAVSQTVAGDDGWHTVTLTQKMTQTRDMEVLLYNLVQSGDAQAGVIYADLRVSSAQRGEVLAEAFEKFDPAAKSWVVEADFEPVLVNLSQSGDASQLAAFLPTLSDPARDRVTRYVYDAAGRQSYAVNAAGAVTQYEYDAAGNVTVRRELANRVPTRGVKIKNADGRIHDIVKYMGSFSAGDVVTATVRCKAPAGLKNDVFLGNAAGPNPYDNAVSQTVAGDDGWHTVTLTQKMTQTRDMEVLLYNLVQSGDAQAGVIYADLRVSSAQRGEVLAEAFEKFDPAAKSWVVEADFEPVLVNLSQSGDASQLAAFLPTLSDLARDRVTVNAYDAAGRLLSVSKGDGISQAQTVRYELDAYGNRVKEWDGNHHLTSREFDALGRVHKETHGEGDATVTDYDAFGNAVKITDPRGNAGYFYFDALGRRILQVDPEGGATRTDYDALGNARAVTRYANAVDPAALQIGILPTVAADAKRDAVSRIDYDALGRQTKITDAEGGVESMIYDAFGNKATYTNQLGAVFSYDYDAAGRVLKETGRDGATVLSVKRFEYDAFGNRTLQVEAEGQPEQRRTSYGYDSLNRLVSQRGDVVHTYTLTGADLKPLEADVAPTETRRYDAAGNLVEFTDANGNVTRSAYDSQNRKVRERNGDGYVTTWAYDGAGNVIEQRVYATAVGLPADGGAPQPADGNCRITQFEYDNNNRLKRTIVPNQQVIALHRQPGDDNGAKSNYDILTSDLVTSRDYDANGNVIRETDANGNLAQARDKTGRSVRRYFDKAGRKLLEVDAAGYAVAWDYNSAGKPLRETRYAAAIGAPADGDTLDAVKARLKTDAQDRISEFDYDLLGRVKEERRLNVAYYNQADFNGAAKDDAIQQTLQTGVVRTQYHYNALGLVDRKTDAKNGVTDIGYDKLGREIHREEAAFANQAGQMVRPTTDTVYNGLGQATQVRKAGVDGVFSETHYGAGGRADWTKDAEGNVTWYDYDAVGNISRTRRDRKEAAGGQDVTLYAYTAAKQQSVKQDVGSGLVSETRYNAWGQVTNKRTSLNRQGDWQEFSEYDGAGRLTRGNAGGVTKLYGYDANGNATMTVESGADSQDLLRSQDLQTVLNRLSDTQGANYQQYLNDYRLKLDDYDARNQHVATYQPRIANATDSQSVQIKAWEVAKPLTGNGDVVTVGAVPKRQGGTANPVAGGTVSIGSGGRVSIVGANFYNARDYSVKGPNGLYWDRRLVADLQFGLVLDSIMPELGSGAIHIKVKAVQPPWIMIPGYPLPDDVYVGNYYTHNGGFVLAQVPMANVVTGEPMKVRELGVTNLPTSVFISLEIYKQIDNVEILVASMQADKPAVYTIQQDYMLLPQMLQGKAEIQAIKWPAAVLDAKKINFRGVSQDVNRLLLLTRPVGSSAGWAIANIPPMQINGQNVAGWFAYDWSGMARGNYEYRYLALDAAGNVKNSGQGQMTLNDSAPSVTPVRDANGQFRSAESTFMLEDGTISFYGVDPSAVQANIRFRRKGGEWGQVFKFDRPSPLLEGGRFILDPKQYALDSGVEYEYQVEFLSGGWQDFGIMGRVPKPKWVLLSPETLNKIVGSFKLGEPQSVTQPTPWSSQTQIVHLSNQSALAASGVVRYRLAGSQGDYLTKALTKSADGPGRFDWDTGENGAPAGNYEFEYQIFDAGGALINRLLGQMALGSNQDVKLDRNSGLILPLGVEFDPKQPSAARLDLSYRVKGGNGDWLQTQIPRNAAGTFLLNVDNWKEGDYEYRFILRDAAGAVVNGADGSALETSGYIHRGSNSSQINGQSLQWVVNKSLYNATVVRRQAYNAFGEVVSETDGVGNATVSDYNAAGKLVAKREARLRLRDDDGNALKNADGSDKLGDEAVTRYGYDAMGNLVSTVDANNHENKQRWLAGSQDGQGKVLRERHADGGSKEMGYDQLGNLRTQTVNGQRQQDYAYDKLGRLKRLDRAPGANGKRGYDEYDYDSAGQRIGHRTTSNGSDVLTDTTRYDSLGRVLDTASAATRHTSYSYVWDTQLKGAGGIVVGGWRMTTTNANQMTMQDATSLFGLKAEHRDLGGRVTQYQYNNAGQLATQSSSNGQNIVYTYYGNGNLQGIEDRAAHQYTLYGYDDDGRKTYEAYANGPNRNSLTFYQQSTLRYDERGRVIEIKDPRFLSRYQYDAVGNRQRVYSVYQDGKDGSRQVQDNWYDYDAMNRFTLSQGSRDASGNLARGSRGVSVEYDGFGQRAKVTNGSDGTVETYSYTADGYLVDTQINGKTAFHRDNDLLGRVTDSASYDWKNGDGGSKASQTHTDYDGDGKIARQVADGATTTYDLMNDGTVKTTTQVSKGTTTTTYYGYEWWDDAKQSTITAQPYNKDAPGWQPGISHLTYDVNGHLKEAIDEKGQRSLRYVNDAQGVVIRREEIDKQSVYKKQDYYYVDGKQVGAVGNDGPSRVDFAQALAQTSLGNKKDQYRFGVAVSSADFDQNYEPIGPNYPAQAPGSVTAREGDTLQVIAANLWGDRALWYLLADANGLQGTETLKAGQVLRVPNKVTNFHNNSGTYRVYSPGEAIGDVTPTLPEPPPPPPPPGGGGCGGFGMILVAVVAVVAVVFTAGALAPLLAPTLVSTAGVMASGMAVLTSASTLGALAAAGIAGAVGSIVSQGVAMAMGMQDKFSWGQVGLSAFSTAATAGLAGGYGPSAFAGKEMGATVARTMAVNAATQGVAMATGMQKSFSWTSVAASGVAAWATSGIKPDVETNPLANIGYGTMRGMAGGAIQSVLGNDHQPNWSSLAANSFGSAVGDQVVGSLQATERDRFSKADAARGLFSYNEAYDLKPPVADDATARALGFRGDDWALMPERGDEGPTRYIVRKGDTFTSIARNTDRTAAEIALANDVNQFNLRPGRPLAIPGKGAYSDDELAAASAFMDKQNRQRIAAQNAARQQALTEKIRAGVPLLSLKSSFTPENLTDGLLMTFGAAAQIVGNGEHAGQSTQTALGSYRAGYAGRDLGVMDGYPDWAAAGQLTARAGQAFASYGLGAIGYTDMQAARQSWSNGSYGSAIGYGVAATVNAALTAGTVISFGMDSPLTESARAGFTWLRAEGRGLFAEGRVGNGFGPVLDRMYDKYVPFGRSYVVSPESAPSTVFVSPVVESERAVLQRMGVNNRAGTPWADLRQAYQQARGQIDFAHIEADVVLKANGRYTAQGGHFSTSPVVNIVPGTENVGANGTINAQVRLLGSDGNFYMKTNNGGFSSLTPDSWSLAQAKGEMSQAFLGRSQQPNGQWFGSSNGVDFRFFSPTNKVPLWRGYPIYTP
uniref:LysM peptidoglycan-binding domain-containing protein n=1 Tax=Chromobacterium vaccinii TaxID=1108595 RepID=UPI00061821E1